MVDRREIGRITSQDRGPTLMVVAGIHGNEPAGVEAARRVFARLERGDVRLRGELVVYAGNLEALKQGVRYQVKDLNRQWSEATVAAVLQKPADQLDAEDLEQLELLKVLQNGIDRARGRVHLADFHTSSANGIPFIIFGDTLPQRHFVRAFPIPVVIGLEEQVDGVLSAYWTRRGCVTFTVEGGQHTDPNSVDSLEAALWIAMEEAELIGRDSVPELKRSHAFLEERRSNLPRVLEVVSRKSITAEDAFKMEPGFRNLDHAPRGQLLATDKNGEIRAPANGMVILPLYQGLGNDGFFWGRAVSGARLRTSEFLRTLGVDRFLRLLPGVERDTAHPSRFIINTKVAKLYPLDVFHMFGYRKLRQVGAELTVERQAE